MQFGILGRCEVLPTTGAVCRSAGYADERCWLACCSIRGDRSARSG